MSNVLIYECGTVKVSSLTLRWGSNLSVSNVLCSFAYSTSSLLSHSSEKSESPQGCGTWWRSSQSFEGLWGTTSCVHWYLQPVTIPGSSPMYFWILHHYTSSQRLDSSSMNDFRPVALTPVVMKCLKKLVLTHINHRVLDTIDPRPVCIPSQSISRWCNSNSYSATPGEQQMLD